MKAEDSPQPGPAGSCQPPDQQTDDERTAVERQAYEVVRDRYNLGDILDVRQVFGGYCNLSFMVTVRADGGERRYFLRKYNSATIENEIGFELSLLEHLTAQGFHICAGVVRSATSSAYECRPEEDGCGTCYWALYDFLEGENKYSWVDNELTEKEYAGAARLLAQFHHYAAGFDPGDFQRVQPPILELVRQLPQTFLDCVAGDKGAVADKYLLSRLDDVLDVLASIEFPRADLEQMPKVPTHCDYHPGNLKYAGEEICGLFDFDWSKIDYRLFDVAEGIVYFCSSWKPEEEGQLWLPAAATFARAYQEEASRYEKPGPLNAAELRNFVRMLECANLYVLNWDITYYYGPGDPDPEEYLGYLRHNILLMDFIREHREQIESVIVGPLSSVAAS